MLKLLLEEMQKLSSQEKAKASSWFFKTGPGQYGEGDKFMGLTVPEQRILAKKYTDLPLEETLSLLKSPIHEERLTALFIFVNKFKKGDEKLRNEIYNLYLENAAKYVNNWDLVDSSAEYIVGPFLDNKPKDVLKKLAQSSNLWEKRIAMIATFYFIQKGDPKPTFEIGEILLNDREDLIQKAVGWMLREVGKKCGKNYLVGFLDSHAKTMPRTALRYAIEHFSPEERKHYLLLKTSL